MTRPDDPTRQQPAVASAADAPTREQPAVAPTLSTAPAPARAPRWWSAIPRHLGRARTSTVVLGLLFLAIGALYLNVRPDPAAPAGSNGGTEQAPATGSTAPSPAPAPTTPAPTTEEEAPATEEPTTTPVPTPTPEDSTTPEEPTETELPGPAPTTPLSEPPTTAAPTS